MRYLHYRDCRVIKKNPRIKRKLRTNAKLDQGFNFVESQDWDAVELVHMIHFLEAYKHTNCIISLLNSNRNDTERPNLISYLSNTALC